MRLDTNNKPRKDIDLDALDPELRDRIVEQQVYQAVSQCRAPDMFSPPPMSYHDSETQELFDTYRTLTAWQRWIVRAVSRALARARSLQHRMRGG